MDERPDHEDERHSVRGDFLFDFLAEAGGWVLSGIVRLVIWILRSISSIASH